jgi:hypothetical protein
MNDEFRECVCLVFESIGLDRPMAGYLDDLERVNNAAAEWHDDPTRRALGFLHFDMPDLLAGEVVTGSLCAAETAGWCLNDAARDFVRFVDERSGRRGTLLMLQVILLLQQAVQTNVNAAGGSA